MAANGPVISDPYATRSYEPPLKHEPVATGRLGRQSVPVPQVPSWPYWGDSLTKLSSRPSPAAECPWPGTLSPPVGARPRCWPAPTPAGMLADMSEVTRILTAIEQGDPHAAGELLALVYEELRQLAAHKMAQEAAGQTLQPTALVHEAYLRLVGEGHESHWDNRGHFIAAAAEAMRRILIENARRKS